MNYFCAKISIYYLKYLKSGTPDTSYCCPAASCSTSGFFFHPASLPDAQYRSGH